MSNLVEYIVKIRDLGSGQMQKFANNADGSFNKISGSMNRAGASVNDLNRRIDALTKSRNMALDTSAISRANKELDQLERKRDRLTNSGRSGGMNGSVLRGALGIAGIGSMAVLGGSIMKAGMERQMAGTSFQVMAGAKQGAELHSNLIKFATDTIYGNEVFGEAKTMLGFGVAAKNIMPAMRMLGDIAMGDVEHMKSLSLAFSQTAAAGKLTGQDLLQYVGAGFNPLQALSEKTHRSMADLRQDMSDGKISFNDLVSAMQYSTGPMGRFYEGMQRMGDTPTGKWQAFTGALSTLAGTIGVQLLPALGHLAGFMNTIINNKGALFEIAIAVGAMTAAWAAYNIVTKWATVSTMLLEGALTGGIGLIAAAIGGLVVYHFKLFDSAAPVMDKLTQKNDAYGNSALIAANKYGTAADKIIDANKKINFSQNGLKDIVNVLNTNKLNQKLEDLAYKKEQSFLAAHGSITDKDIQKIRKQVGLIKPTTASPMAGAGGVNGMSSTPSAVSDSAKGISAGGIRNFTINIAKQGIDQITIHAATLKEGKEDIQRLFLEMFDQIINSGNAVVGTN